MSDQCINFYEFRFILDTTLTLIVFFRFRLCLDTRKAVEIAVMFTSNIDLEGRKINWISVAFIELVDAPKFTPPGSELDEERRQLECNLIESLRNNRYKWLVTKAE